MQKDFREKIKQDTEFAEEIFNRGLLEGAKHSVPSPETIARFEKLDLCLQELTAAIKSLENHSHERGKKVDEMYEYFTRGSNVVWFIKWIFGTAAAIGGLIIMVKSILNNGN
jgi:hypothetical protein